MPAPNSTFSQILSTTLYNYITSGELADNIFEGLRTFSVLVKKGGIIREDGGDSLIVQIEYAKNTTVKWMSEYDQLSTTPQDVLTSAQFNWKQLSGSAIVTDLEAAKNNSKFRVANLVEAKIKNLVHSMQDNFNTALFNTGTDPTQPNGLPTIVSTTGTFGGISRSAQTWWQAGYVDTTTTALAIVDMVTAWNAVWHNLETPDLIVTTKGLYAKYEALSQAFQRITENNTADVGFECLRFKGVPLIWDAACNSTYMYFLNTKFLKIYAHRDFEFKLLDPIRSPNQLLTIHPVVWFGNVVPTACRFHGVLQNRS